MMGYGPAIASEPMQAQRLDSRNGLGQAGLSLTVTPHSLIRALDKGNFVVFITRTSFFPWALNGFSLSRTMYRYCAHVSML
jgi:hypothetical protein